MMRLVVCACLAVLAHADLRRASQPEVYKILQRNKKIPFQARFPLYMEPSDFNYDGLKKQRDGGGFDNFLRSNIDNEQDRRNFNTEAGEDHLPFRTFRTAGNDAGETTIKHKMKPASKEATGLTEAGNYVSVTPGEPFTVPLRWNNPHSSELEVNIWIMNKGNKPFVIPIRRPTCSGEGYQDNAFTFTVPSDFNDVASCRKVGECVLQVYAHSVESRMYASGTPVIVTGGTGKWNGTPKKPEKDVGFDLHKLRRLCLPSSDPKEKADWPNAVIYEARLSSDVYNHAYQNSDFSPYAGQQPQFISQNLQASAILKMHVGNFGELGKEYMKKTANEARDYANKLDKKARNLIRIYETIANAIIGGIQKDVQNNDTMAMVDPDGDAVFCTEWRDRYDRVSGGNLRGKDYTGGWCPKDYTCLCRGDCIFGTRNSLEDAYCGILIPDGSMVPKKLDNGQDFTDDNGEKLMIPSGKKVLKEGSAIHRNLGAQMTETCFRCAEVGSTVTKRHNTNTYVPSFEIHGVDEVEKALLYVAPIYFKYGFMTNPDTGAISQKGDDKAIVQIYMAVLSQMWKEFQSTSDGSYLEKYYKRRYDKLAEPKAASLEKYKFSYRGPVYKTTKNTLADEKEFKKLDKDGKQDKGYYAASRAWPLQTGAKVAWPIPQNTEGPLEDKTIPRTFNHYDGVASGGNNIKYFMPPKEAPTDSCSNNQKASNSDTSNSLALEGDDMDGLNADADCDTDAYVEEFLLKLEEDCEANEDLPLCNEPYPEPSCTIPGQQGRKPGQLFTNDDVTENPSSAGAIWGPSLSVIALAVALIM